MKLFDSERALAGDPVITRDGRKVLELMLLKTESVEQRLIAVIESHNGGLPVSTNFNPKTGRYFAGNVPTNSPNDLFMDTIKNTYYSVSTKRLPFQKLHIKRYTTQMFSTEAEAVDDAKRLYSRYSMVLPPDYQIHILEIEE